MTLPMKMFFGLLAQQSAGPPPGNPYHIQTLCYEGDGTTYRRFNVPGVDLSTSGSGMLIIRCLTASGDTMAFASWSATEGYALSSREPHEQCGPHRISEMGDGYFVLGTNPNWYNKIGESYSAIAIDGREGSKYFDTSLRQGGNAVYSHSLGIEPKTLWINENTGNDKASYNARDSLEPEKQMMLLNLTVPSFTTNYWNETRPTASQYHCTTIQEHEYFAFGDVSGVCLTASYECHGSPITIDLGFKPKFAVIKEYFDDADWYWFSEAMEACNRYHVGTISSAPTGDLVDFVSNGIYLKDSRLIKPTWYNILAIG